MGSCCSNDAETSVPHTWTFIIRLISQMLGNIRVSEAYRRLLLTHSSILLVAISAVASHSIQKILVESVGKGIRFHHLAV